MRAFKILVLVSALLITGLNPLNAQEENNFEISKNLEIYGNVLRQLNLNYADDIKPGELTQTAIDKMLQGLDPYTVYIPESRIEDFELMSKGEYGGIGAMIQKLGDWVVISEPYEGFPAQKAGLRAGDEIRAIDGDSARGKSTKDVSERLKGTPGTEVQLTIRHFGEDHDTTYVLKREKIKIPNVPYYGMVSKDVGYISLLQFSNNAGNDVRNAFLDLKAKHPDLKGIIFDLRSNGGGLLNEAVNIANIWIPKGQKIVTTKGKRKENTHSYYTKNKATDAKIPLVILVDDGTASASEIVSGSVQDLDRGVIIGQRTFGKGLVQNVLPLPYNSKIKVTIAKYYIPSGRCIQAINYFHRENGERPEKIPDSLINAFKTKHGRTVYDGGGIEPDIKMKERSFNQVTGDLYAQNYIFKFANIFQRNHKTIAPPSEFRISDSTFEAFKEFVGDKFDYKTETEELIKRLKKSAEREGYNAALDSTIKRLEAEVKHAKKKDLDKNKDEIKELLRIEIVTRYYYQKGKVEASLINDKEVKKAIEVINDNELYKSILDGTYKPEEGKEK
jgi:carboxyl-terminal processing protease